MDWSHIKERRWGSTKTRPYGTLKDVGTEEDPRLAREDRSPKKWVEAGMNYGSWRFIDRSEMNS
jgi:hypothetical protein